MVVCRASVPSVQLLAASYVYCQLMRCGCCRMTLCTCPFPGPHMLCCPFVQALASTSATPGHTTSFHFYTINQPDTTTAATGRISVSNSADPLCSKNNGSVRDGTAGGCGGSPFTARFVDVPGLGFAGKSPLISPRHSLCHLLVLLIFIIILLQYRALRQPQRVDADLVERVDRALPAPARRPGRGVPPGRRQAWPHCGGPRGKHHSLLLQAAHTIHLPRESLIML